MIGFENPLSQHRELPPVGAVTQMFKDSQRNNKEKPKARRKPEGFSLIFDKACKEIKDER